MWATINTDASYSNYHRVGAFAFWIVVNGTRFFSAGPLKGKIESPSVAELMAIVKALSFLQALQSKGQVPKITHIHLNTDSLNSIHIVSNDTANIKRYGLNKGQYKTVCDSWKKIRKYEWQIKCNHVRSHVHAETKRNYVNEWCDTNAKKHLPIPN